MIVCPMELSEFQALCYAAYRGDQLLPSQCYPVASHNWILAKRAEEPTRPSGYTGIHDLTQDKNVLARIRQSTKLNDPSDPKVFDQWLATSTDRTIEEFCGVSP